MTTQLETVFAELEELHCHELVNDQILVPTQDSH